MITTVFDTAAIFRREFTARWGLLWAALYIAVLIVVVPLWPFISHFERADVRDLMSVGSALGAGLALSIGLGATFFGRDLSEGRLGFYFERPVRSVAVWLGRFLAVLSLVVLFEGLILIPAWLSSSWGVSILTFLGWPDGLGIAGWTAIFVAGPAFLLLLAHAVGVMARAKTAWLVLDLLGFMSTGVVAWLCVRPFVEGHFDDALLVVGLALAASALAALLAAFAVGVHLGRCDLARAHRALSITLWGVVAVTFGAVAAYSAWLSNFGPSELGEFRVTEVAANGPWIEVEGTSPGHLDVERSFLFSTTDSRWMPVPPRSYARFSENGQRALLIKERREGKPGFVSYVDLNGSELEPVDTTIVVDNDADDYLSPSGRYLAIREESVLSVYELDEERLMTAIRLPEDLREDWLQYVGDSVIRLSDQSGEPGDWTISIHEVDIGTGAIKQTGLLTVELEYFSRSFSQDSKYAFIKSYRYPDSSEIGHIVDVRTGEVIRPIEGFWRFLSDGRVLRVIRDGDDAESIVVEEPTGEGTVVKYDLPNIRDLRGIWEGRSEYLLFEHSPGNDESGYVSYRVVSLNLESGEMQRVGEGLRPEGGLLFRKGGHTLVRWDPDSGELVPVVVGLGRS
jgi:hypothetical protein